MGGDGEPSYIKTTSQSSTGNDIKLIAHGGKTGRVSSYNSNYVSLGGTCGGVENSNTGVGGTGGDAGGTSGGGGGGACGYNGNGGRGGEDGSLGASSSAGTNGGGGGGGSSQPTAFVSGRNYNSGGGVGIYGRGYSGSAGQEGTSDSVVNNRGRGGSGGTDGSTTLDHQDGGGDVIANQYWLTGGGLYGGGGSGGIDGSSYPPSSGNDNHAVAARPGGQGAVRIVWSTGNRQYPTTNVGDGTFPLNKRTVSLNASGWTFVTFGVTSDYKTFTSVNGESKTTGSVTDWNNSETINFTDIFGDGTTNFSCFWNSCMIYDKELSDSEIEQNYNVFKERFDI